MATRKIQDSKLDTRTAREKLKARGMPYYRKIEGGLAVGYRKLRGQQAGTWWCRHYVGEKQYNVERLGTADDFTDAFAKGSHDDRTVKLLDAVADPVITFDQAQALARARRGKRETGVTGPLTVKDALEAYFDKIEDEGRSSHDARRRIEPYLDWIANTECDKLKATELRKWLSTIARTPARLRTRKGEKQQYRELDHDDAEAIRKRKATANRQWTILRAALNSAYHDGEIATAAEWERVKPFEDVDVARIRFLSQPEAQRLINASDPEFRPMVEAALATGCRYGELCRLQAQDFSYDKETDKNGKPTGKLIGTITIQRSKSGKVRHVVLAEKGIELFRRLTAGRAATDLVLHKNGKPWTTAAQGRPMREACEHAKIKPAISIHILRHTWASLTIKAGVPPWIVAKNLGHSDTRMVEKHYGHVEQTFISEALRKGAPQFESEPSNVTAVVR